MHNEEPAQDAILVDLKPGPGLHKTSLTDLDKIMERSEAAIDDAMRTIDVLSKRLITTIDSSPHRPSEVELTFGLKLTLSGNALVTTIGAESTIEVTLKWSKNAQPDEPSNEKRPKGSENG